MQSPIVHEPVGDVAGVRSQRVETVLRYLDELAARAAKPPGYVPPRLMGTVPGASVFDSIRQRVRVIDDRRGFDRWRAEELERLRAAGQDTDRLAYDLLRSGLSAEDGPEAREGPSPIEWDERAARKFRRAIVLGDPGFGKSWLLRYEARRLAREAANALRRGHRGLHEIVLPLLMPLPHLASESDGPIEEALIEHAVIGLPKSSKVETDSGARIWGVTETQSRVFGDVLRGKLKTGDCAVLLDGWDEVVQERRKSLQPRPHYRQRLAERLDAFAREYPNVRLLLSSRIVGYDGSPIPGATELELMPFHRRQVEGFVDAWFCDAARANRFKRALRRNPEVAGLARIPLLLSLLCSITEDPRRDVEELPSCRSDLYELVLRGLVRDWPVATRDHPPLSDPEVEQLFEMLAPVAYELFAGAQEQFEQGVIEETLTPHTGRLDVSHTLRGKGAKGAVSAEKVSEYVVESLKRDGVLVRAGTENGHLIFLHRTFHEYLAAKGLAECEDPLAVVRDRLHDPRWREVLRLVGHALGEDVGRCLVMLLESVGEDVLLRPFHLAAHMAAEARDGTVAGATLKLLVRQTSALWFDRERWLEDDRVSGLMAAWGDSAVMALAARLADEEVGSDVRELAADALGLTGSEAAVKVLVPLLAGSDRRVRWHVADALGLIGSDTSVDALVLCLADEDRRVRGHAASALRGIGSEAVVHALVRRLEHGDSRVRGLAVATLGEIGSEVAVDPVARLVDDRVASVRASAVQALGLIGSKAAVDALAARLADEEENWDLRERSAFSLGLTRSEAAVHALVLCLTNEEEDLGVRLSAAEALGRIGSAPADSALVGCLADGDAQLRASVASALGPTGSEGAVAALVPRLADEDEVVRRRVVEALAENGSQAALGPLMERLADQDEDMEVRWRAARGLGRLGSVEAIEALGLRLADDDECREVRMSSAEALGRIGSESAVHALVPGLADGDEGVRGRAARALGLIGSDATVDALMPCLDAESGLLRANAAEALGLIRAQEAVPRLLLRLADEDEERWVRERTVEALGRIGSEVAIDVLALCLVDEDSALRERAAEALRRIGAADCAPIPPYRAPVEIRASLRAFADACLGRAARSSGRGSRL